METLVLPHPRDGKMSTSLILVFVEIGCTHHADYPQRQRQQEEGGAGEPGPTRKIAFPKAVLWPGFFLMYRLLCAPLNCLWPLTC